MNVNENINIKQILDILKKRRLLIISILVVFIIFGYIYSYKYVIPRYKSTSTLLLIPNPNSQSQEITNSDLTLNSGLISTYSSIAKDSKVLRQVINNLNLKMTEAELLNKLQVSPIKNTYIIEISIQDINPRKAMLITEELANVFLKEIQDIYNLNNIGIIDKANLPEFPYNINHVKDLSMFLFLGVLVSLLSIIITFVFNNKIETEEEIEKYVNIKSLGNIPINLNSKDEIIDKTDIKSYAAECLNTIRTNILYMNTSKNAKTILITSCTPGEGKSWVSANIATSFSDIHKKVLLIDADLRKGRANKIFGVNNKSGLCEYLYSMVGNKKDDLKLAKKYIKKTFIPNLHILTTGNIPQNPSELLASNNMKDLIELLKTAYDIIIVDAPPSKSVTDSIILSTIVDSTVLVVNSNKTTINDLKDVKKSIELVGGQIIGAILNKVKMTSMSYKNTYYYGNLSNSINYINTDEQYTDVDIIIDKAIEKLDSFLLPVVSSNIICKDNNYIKINSDSLLNTISRQLENFSVDMNNKIQTVIDNNKITLEISNANAKNLNMLTKQVNYIINTNNSLKNMQFYINNQLQHISNNTANMKSYIDTTKQEFNNITENKNIEKQISLLLSDYFVKMQQYTENLLKQQIANIDYSAKINDISNIVLTLQNNYSELSNIIKSSYYEDSLNNSYYSQNIIDLKLLKKNKTKKTYDINQEIIPYNELEKSSLYIIPINSNKIRSFNKEQYTTNII